MTSDGSGGKTCWDVFSLSFSQWSQWILYKFRCDLKLRRNRLFTSLFSSDAEHRTLTHSYTHKHRVMHSKTSSPDVHLQHSSHMPTNWCIRMFPGVSFLTCIHLTSVQQHADIYCSRQVVNKPQSLRRKQQDKNFSVHCKRSSDLSERGMNGSLQTFHVCSLSLLPPCEALWMMWMLVDLESGQQRLFVYEQTNTQTVALSPERLIIQLR